MYTDDKTQRLRWCATWLSPIGWLKLSFEAKALVALRIVEEDEVEASADRRSTTDAQFQSVCRWLDTYFSGREPDFQPLLAPRGTPFQQQVWAALRKIPYGTTVTYGELAARIGCRSAQAVGQAVGHNPIAIVIPCHRVVGRNGLGGYAYGIECKRQLLKIENIVI